MVKGTNIEAEPGKMHDYLSNLWIFATDSNFLCIEKYQLAHDRVATPVVCANSHHCTERRILCKRIRSTGNLGASFRCNF